MTAEETKSMQGLMKRLYILHSYRDQRIRTNKVARQVYNRADVRPAVLRDMTLLLSNYIRSKREI